MNKSLALVLLALLGGCASPTPNYDLRFGDAVRDARQKMTLNPNAGADPDNNLGGMDGRSAREAVGRYQNSFKAPPPVVNVINIGSSNGSSQ